MVAAPFSFILVAALSLPSFPDNDNNNNKQISPSKTNNNNDNGVMNNIHCIEIENAKALREAVVGDRRRKSLGVFGGGAMFLAGGGVGVAAGILEAPQVAAPIAVVALGAFAWATSLEEDGDPLPDSYFEVKESNIPGAGQGLFATRAIEMGSFMFPYTGERIDEDEYFARYPDGQGLYVAELPAAPWSSLWEDPIYVDGVDSTLSGLARWMNSRSDDSGCNVVGRKSVLGKDRNLYFYAARDIVEGEELCFDYGSNYWDAVIDE